ncbi:Protein kinase-like domain protein [Cordyceps fumosorosea ARSEF 2679]|uniref:Protein kinase-like domain protein n=1 Tax=Cordyceps fumosorosea (strain ARSEF 2679) TaxID=1081104 RepID=A0A162MEP7_CORFA|nr:Protein kinase-like domain protein [Cordyceps fumosorosea ARSEF 2679]OAA55110.1 Protein kinase-like domain protein [Cordyceps fumosorosea ARSEF 2679]
MSATDTWLHVKEVWGESSDKEGGAAAAKTTWKPKRLELMAFDGYAAYVGTRSLSARGRWMAGIYKDLDDATFSSFLSTMHRIPDSAIYPLLEEGLTQFDPGSVEGKEEGRYFLKSPSAAEWKGGDDTAVADLFLAEARTHQQFLATPHPHLGAYVGCVVHEGRIVRLAFPRYVESLYERVERMRPGTAAAAEERMGPEERRACMRAVGAAVAHLHRLGYAHNDVSATNIMFDAEGGAVLIDLDSCTPMGEHIKKGGVVGGWRGPMFSGREFKISSVECDEVSLRYIDDWLSGKQK